MKSRGQKAVYNVAAGITEEIVTMICGLILPRLILSAFGSTYNGLVSSISQFISVVSLMKAGIGGATRAALYKPLAEKDNDAISAIVNQTDRFMKRVATIFIAFIIVFACFYSYLIRNDFDWLFSFTLIIIISLSTFAQYYFGFTYQMLLSASQNQRVVHYIHIGATIANTIIASVLILLGASIHIVKLGSAIVFVLSPYILSIYTRRKFNINKKIAPNTDLINQRWDAVAHEVANFINTNTDIMVLTVFTSLVEVSVYSVHYLVINSLRKVVTNFVSSFGAAFGDMYAKKEKTLLHSNLRLFELIVFSLVSIIYSVTCVMLTPFVMVYTSGVNDVNYFRPAFSIVITLAGAFSCIRIPYETVVKSAGHYRQTRNGAIAEAAINITISIICVIRMGLIGVAVGTVAAAVFRTFQYAIYMSRAVVVRSISYYVKHLIIALFIICTTYFVSSLYMTEVVSTVSEWIIYAVITTIIAILLTLITDYLFYKQDLFNLIIKMKNVVKIKSAK